MSVDKVKIHFWSLILSIFIFGLSAYASDSLETIYQIQADFRNIKQRTFPIEMRAIVTNHSTQAISNVVWMIYPNRFLKELPNINDLNYRRIYPNGFSSGELHIESLQEEGLEVVKKLQIISKPSIPEKTLYRLELEKPLAPRETRTFQFVMKLHVPKKYGSFGYYNDRLTMSGGWTPYLVSFRDGEFEPTDQSPQANWEVTLTTDCAMVIGNEVVQQPVDQKTFLRVNTGQFPLQIGKHLQIKQYIHKGYQLKTVVEERRPEKIVKSIESIFDPWVEYVEELKADPSATSRSLTFVQAPLREMLGVDAGDMSFFSDRAYKVIQVLKQFHNVPLIRMMFSQMIYPQVLKKENARDYFWVNEVVSTQLAEDFLQTQHYKIRDARKLGVMRMFSIFPLIDQLIHTPQFAFFDVFYNFSYPYDPVRDEFMRFQQRRQYGKSVITHMEDELGAQTVKDIVLEYIRSPDQNFLEISEKYTGKKLQERFSHWTSQRPVLNYKLSKIKSKKLPDGYDSSVLVQKESNKPIQEPVEIKVTEKNGKSQTVVWDAKDSEEIFHFKTKSKLDVVEVDPRQRLLETKLSDNRRPPYWKFVLTEFFMEYDFNSNHPLLFAQSQLRKKYGGQDRYNLGGFYQVDSYGINIGYSRLFGRSLDSLRLSHGLGFQYGFSRLNPDDVFVDANPDQIVRMTDSGFLSTVTMSYFFGNQISYTNPLQGEYGGIAFTYGSSYLGGQFDFYEISASASKVLMLHPSHLLAFKGLVGTSGPDDMPSQVQFRLGGITAMRGLGIGEEKYIGRNMVLFSGEYRHFLIQDIDINLGIFRVRDIQGALFTDAGRVTNTVQENANALVIGNSVKRTSMNDLFDVRDFSTDVGYGLRFFVEYLGVSPALIRFDLARSISDHQQGYRFYFGVTQSF